MPRLADCKGGLDNLSTIAKMLESHCYQIKQDVTSYTATTYSNMDYHQIKQYDTLFIMVLPG